MRCALLVLFALSESFLVSAIPTNVKASPLSPTSTGASDTGHSSTDVGPSQTGSATKSATGKKGSSATKATTTFTSQTSAVTSGINPSSINSNIDGCGAVSAYYNPTPQDWQSNGLDSWLDAWIKNNQSQIKANADGFTGAFGSWAVGNPDFSCRDDGSTSDCDFNPCGIALLNNKGPLVRQTYYVMESINRLHSYFMGLRQSFSVSGIAAALSKDEWALTFYKDKDDVSATVLKEIFNVLTTVVGIAASFASLAGAGASVAAGAASAIFAGAIGAANPLIGQHQDDTFVKSADLGAILGQIVVGSIEAFTEANNVLMSGGPYQDSGDIRAYLRGGTFVAYPGIDKNAVTNTMNNFLLGQAINQLYRVQKIFILGGAACGDNQGIGNGPQEATICRDGKAWYLYYWQENDVISTTSHQWGWMASPPGADQLGSGSYAGVKVTDIISSSLDSYNVAGYSYTNATAAQRAEAALKDGWANPGQIGPSWEGTFTIPVCDIGGAVNSDYSGKQWILQPYDHDSRPYWCGPICSGDVQRTKDFIHAANMDGFQSPHHACDNTPAGEVWW